jgi:hypothetical protein
VLAAGRRRDNAQIAGTWGSPQIPCASGGPVRRARAGRAGRLAPLGQAATGIPLSRWTRAGTAGRGHQGRDNCELSASSVLRILAEQGTCMGACSPAAVRSSVPVDRLVGLAMAWAWAAGGRDGVDWRGAFAGRRRQSGAMVFRVRRLHPLPATRAGAGRAPASVPLALRACDQVRLGYPEQRPGAGARRASEAHACQP